MAEIRIDYDMTIARAKRIKELADSLHRVMSEIRRIEDDTRDIWQGEAANIYRSQCEVLEDELYNAESKMNRLSETVIKIANAIKQTDDQIALAAGNLGGTGNHSSGGFGGGHSSGGSSGGGGSMRTW